MSGNWNSKPRRGEKSVATQRSDHEHAIRKEYKAAGELDGLVVAWGIATDAARSFAKSGNDALADGARSVALSIAVVVLDRSPKAGRSELVRFGIADDVLAHAERCRDSARAQQRSADRAARELGRELGELGIGTVNPKAHDDGT